MTNQIRALSIPQNWFRILKNSCHAPLFGTSRKKGFGLEKNKSQNGYCNIKF